MSVPLTAPTPAPVHLEFQYTEQDYVRAMRLLHARRMRPRLDVPLALLLLVGCTSALLLGAGWAWGVGAGLGALVLAMYALALFVVPARAFRAQPKLQHPYVLDFTPAGIHFRTAGVDSQLQWSLYRELRSDAHTHLLMYGENQCTILPRRVFAGPAQEEAFLALVRAALGPHARAAGGRSST